MTQPTGAEATPTRTRDEGVLPSQAIRELVRAGAISADAAVGEDQVQPASLDLRLGRWAWRVPASFLPGENVSVERRLADLAMYRIDLLDGAVLETDCVYIAEVEERLRLPRGVSALATPKSST